METKMDFASQNLTAGQLNAIVKNLGGEEGALKFLRGELTVQTVVIPEPVLDFLVRVDRSVKPSYPEWVKKLVHLHMESLGPTEYDLQVGVEQWLHDDQKKGVRGHVIYDHLLKNDALVNCLGLADLLAIQAKGLTVFRKLFAGKAVFGWKSVVQSDDGRLSVPYLFESGGGVALGWRWLGSYWGARNPALRFAK